MCFPKQGRGFHEAHQEHWKPLHAIPPDESHACRHCGPAWEDRQRARSDSGEQKPFDAAIKKLAALSPAQYERVRKDEAKRRGVRVKILDKFVVAAKPLDESTPGQGRPIELPDVVPWDALIGRLPSTLDDRSLHVEIKRKTSAEKVAPFRLGRIPDLDELARKAAHWAADNVEALRGSDPKMPLGVENRAADNWEPLFAIADLVGERWAKEIKINRNIHGGYEGYQHLQCGLRLQSCFNAGQGME